MRASRTGGSWWYRRRFSLLVALLSAVLAFVTTLTLPAVLGGRGWWLTPDVWYLVATARWIGAGGLRTAYEAAPWQLAALPGFPALISWLPRIGDALGLVDGWPAPVAYPSMWLLVGPVFSLCAATLVPAVDGMAEAFGVRRRSRALLAVSVGALVVAPTVVFEGHPEDMMALGSVCVSLTCWRKGRFGCAAGVLGLGILMQDWAGLVIPVLVAISPAGRRLRTLLVASLPGLVVGSYYILASPIAAAEILGQPVAAIGQHLPWWGVARWQTFHAQGYRLRALAGSSTRVGAVVLAALAGAVLLLRRRAPDARVVLLATAVVLLGRGLFEAEVWPSYLAPGAVMLVSAGAAVTRGWRLWAMCAAGFLIYSESAMAVIGGSIPPDLAFAAMGGAGLLGVMLLVTAPSAPPSAALPDPDLLPSAHRELRPAISGVA